MTWLILEWLSLLKFWSVTRPGFGPGSRVAITATTAAEPLARALFELVLDRGGNPHILFDLPGQDEILFAHASDAQLDYLSPFQKAAFEEFDVLSQDPL